MNSMAASVLHLFAIHLFAIPTRYVRFFLWQKNGWQNDGAGGSGTLSLALLWMLLVLSLGVARAEEPLDSAARIHALSAEEADRALPVTLEGVVTFYDRRWNALFIQDRSGGLYVKIASDNPAVATLRAGLRVQVEGVTGRGHFLPEVRGRDGAGAALRIMGEAARPEPVRVPAAELLAAAHHADLVEVQGSVIGRLDNDESTRLILSEDPTVFEARLMRAGGAPILPDWPRDTRLRLTGVCQNLPGEDLSNPQRSLTFMIRLHRREDVQVLSMPPWWTTRRLLWGLAAAAGCALLAGGWPLPCGIAWPRRLA